MTTATQTRAQSAPWRKVVAAAAQVASFFTTLWCVQWIWSAGDLGIQVAIALVAEIGLIVLKERLFAGDDPALGWTGLAIDAIINTGGALPISCRVMTFPPIAALLVAFGVNPAACQIYSIGSVIIALAIGVLLSALPHRLWRS